MWEYRVRQHPTTAGEFVVFWRMKGRRYWHLITDVPTLRRAAEVMKRHKEQLLRYLDSLDRTR